MNVAISGDRGSCLYQEIVPGAHVVALARGFGRVGGCAVAPAVLARVRSELVRRARGGRLCRAARRTNGVMPLLTAALGRANADMHGRSGNNDDYVTAGCSLTAALLIGNNVYLAHAGSTAAYLARSGNVVSLTRNDALETSAGTLVTRAMGCSPALQLAVSSFALEDGDALVLSGRHFTAPEERARQWEREQSLVVHFAAEVPAAEAARANGHAGALLAGVAGTLLFYAMLCLR